MADVDEDIPVNSLYNHQSNDDNEPGDETQDFRLLASLTSKSTSIPKRGEKDFEPHGTKHQDGVLAASRQAMHEALDYTRVHTPKGHIVGFYYGEGGLERDEVVRKDWRQGLDDDHVVVVEGPKGPHFKSMGRSVLGKSNTSLWLLPEEALYLVERGNLDLRWPSRSSFNGMRDDGDEAEDGVDEEGIEGIPMSFQAAYAMLIGDDTQRGKVSLERYTVYANLKRTGYIVLRAPEWDPSLPGEVQSYKSIQEKSPSIFTWLLELFQKKTEYPPYGPLVKPGLHRSYNSIYQQVAVIPRHKPSPIPKDPSSTPNHPYRVVFLLWKATRIAAYAKSNPGVPDFRVAVVDARSTSIPSLSEIVSLLESTPWDPPTEEGPNKLYQRLRHGWRNVVLAIIDQGIISYLRLGEAAFGEDKLYERFDRGSVQGNKRGGYRGNRGRGRGKPHR